MRVGCSLTCEMGVWVLAGIGGGGGVGGGGKRGEARYGIWVIYKSGMRLDTAVKHTATAAVLTGGRCQLDAQGLTLLWHLVLHHHHADRPLPHPSSQNHNPSGWGHYHNIRSRGSVIQHHEAHFCNTCGDNILLASYNKCSKKVHSCEHRAKTLKFVSSWKNILRVLSS